MHLSITILDWLRTSIYPQQYPIKELTTSSAVECSESLREII